jgi:hypothetical protein
MKIIKTHTLLANTIVGEQKAQSMALNVALTNLEAHVRASNTKFKAFQAVASREFSFQIAAIESPQTLRCFEIPEYTRVFVVLYPES